MTERSASDAGEVVACPVCATPMAATYFVKPEGIFEIRFSCCSEVCKDAAELRLRHFCVRSTAEVIPEWFLLKAKIQKVAAADAAYNERQRQGFKFP